MENKAEKKASCGVKLSTPLWVYLICAVLCLLVYGSAFLMPRGTWYRDLFTNLGYGVFASTIVALFIDMGNTKVAVKKDQHVFDMLNAKLKDECANLPSELYTSVYECCGYGLERKLTYHSWLDMLFPVEITEKNEKEIRYFLQQIDTIKTVATQLHESIKVHYGNAFITEQYLKLLTKLIGMCKILQQNAKRKQFDRVNGMLDKEIKCAICDLFPSLEHDFTRAYNEETYMEE